MGYYPRAPKQRDGLYSQDKRAPHLESKRPNTRTGGTPRQASWVPPIMTYSPRSVERPYDSKMQMKRQINRRDHFWKDKRACDANFPAPNIYEPLEAFKTSCTSKAQKHKFRTRDSVLHHPEVNLTF
eukprot:TRINITY_DN3971_c0_g1_i1.p1 TRINITY_DN3971_c0_g1~~TRINITY_DN3971_c0_g1_i1.p1  ORF type:complete len:127 (+),score=6.19 TRINITY_DN3971_c0_g1_i1:54-434(+)